MRRICWLGFVVLFFLGPPTMAAPINELRVHKTPDPSLGKAATLANKLLSAYSDYSIRQAFSIDGLAYDPHGTEIRAFSVRKQRYEAGLLSFQATLPSSSTKILLVRDCMN